VILLIGGARSGKSTTAVCLASKSGLPVTIVATAEARDEEMAARIARHRAERPAQWRTLECPLDLHLAVTSTESGDFLVIDCLTLWVSNLLGADRSGQEILAEGARVAEALRSRHGVVVSNEVGLGIVPANELARIYRDVLGGVNAAFAAAAERSLFMVAGRATELTPVE